MKRVATAATLALALVAIAVAACEKREPLRVETTPPVSADAEAGAPTRPTVGTTAPSEAAAADGAADTCRALMAQYDAVQARAPGACTRDTDCACFADLRFDNRTGVSDQASATELGRLSAEYRARHCPTVDVLVAARAACRSHCQAGSCR